MVIATIMESADDGGGRGVVTTPGLRLNGPGRRGGRVAIITASLLLAVLGARSGLGFALARPLPAQAYAIDWHNEEVVAAVANARAVSAQDDEQVAEVRELARDALLLSPYAPFALRSYALATLVEKNEATGAPMMEIAGRLTLRDYLTHAWLFDLNYRRADIPRALREADIVLTQRQASADIVIPPLLTLLSDERTIAPLARSLARSPVWRERFVEEMGLQPEDGQAKFALLATTTRLGAPFTTKELTPYFNTFIDSVPPRELRRRWDLLTRSEGPGAGEGLTDGSFEAGALPPPFSWRLYPSEEVFAELLGRADGRGKALFASYNGRENARFASQLVLLNAGRYRLTGEMLGEEGVRPQEFRWQLYCDARGVTEPVFVGMLNPSNDDWRTFAFDLTVPADCPATLLTLTAHVTGTPRAATIWVDTLALKAR